MAILRRLIALLLAGVACAALFSHVPRAQTGGAGGQSHSVLLVNGEVWTAGGNFYGQLGVGAPTGGPSRHYRTQVVPFYVAAVAAGSEHSLAMMSDGSMYAWGNGYYGQLGLTPSGPRTSPIAVPLSGIVAISAASNRSFAVGPGGVVYMFGHGYLGDGAGLTYVYTPTQVPNITGAVGVAAGNDHVLLVMSDGSVLAWGNNASGQLGDGTTTPRLTPQAVPGLEDIVQVAAGSGFSVALNSSGQVYAWGENGSGSVGDGTQIDKTSPVLVTGLNGLTITQISAGYSHALARASDGTVRAWGEAGAGQIGEGPASGVRTSATFITTLPNTITKVAAAYSSSFAFAADGRVWGWGRNDNGQLGDGTITSRYTPTLLTEASASGNNWIVGTPVFSGSSPNTPGYPSYGTVQTVNITTATPGATVRYTTNGNVPTESDPEVPAGGVVIDRSLTLKARAFKTGMPPSHVTSGDWVLKVNPPTVAPPGTTYSSAVTVTLHAPGAEIRYTLDGSEPSIASPLYQTPLSIATKTTLKIRGFRTGWEPSGTVTHNYSFSYGTLAAPTMSPVEGTYDTDQTITLTAAPGAQIRYTIDGTTTPHLGSTLYTAPILRSATTTLKARAFHDDWATSPTTTGVYTLQVGTPTLSLTSGEYAPGQVVTIGTSTPGATLRFTTNGAAPTLTDAVVPATGTLVLGNFTLKVAGFKTGYVASNVASATYALSGDLTARRIAARYYSSFALSKDGVLSAFGFNGSGQVGDNTTTQRNVPVRVQGITGVVDVAAGSNHALAVLVDGRVFAWGDNGNGRLGDNSTNQRRLPVLVAGLPFITRVAAGASHSLAVTATGQVYAWGHNGSGRLGDGTTTDRWVPTLVPGLSDVVGVAAGETHSLAWTSTGDVWAWGANNYNQIGDGTNTSRLSPVQILTLSDVKQMAAGERHSIAVTNGGSVYTWGGNSDGQIGDGTNTQRTSPFLIPALSNIAAVGTGALHNLAVTSTGAVYVWGENVNYQLGDGTQTDRRSPVLLTGVSGIVRVAGGLRHSLALDDDGEVWVWGQGPYGQLGNGYSNADPGATQPTPIPLNPGTVPAPSASPTPGTYTSAQSVTLSASAGTTIRYTLDGSEPDGNSGIYTAPLIIGVTTTVKAKAFQNDWTPSATTTAVYTIQETATPVITPPTGTYTSAQTVTMTTATPGATIRYTLDGAEPSASSPSYSAPFDVSTSTTVKAKAFKSGVADSQAATSTITLNYGTLETPTVSPAGGTYELPQTVTLSSIGGASIRYTLDGNEPTQASPAYTGPISVATTSTLRARAYHADWTPSAVMAANYTIAQDTMPPTITWSLTPSPNELGWHRAPVTVNFECQDNVGIESCTAPVTIASDVNQRIVTGEARDTSNNTSTTSVTVRLDSTLPVVAITAPLANAQIADPQLDVTATVSDAGAGLATATCNGVEGTVSGNTISCTVTLAPGANTISVEAVDGAGNEGSTSVAVTRVIDPGTCEPTAGGELQITPGKLTLLGDQERGVRVVDSNGQTPENVAWSIADPAIAELVDDEGGLFVRARTPGSTCVIAAVANAFAIAPVEVVAAGAAIAGQPQWSIGPTLSLAPVSANDPEGHVAMFTADYFDGSGLGIRALDADGLELWRRTLSNGWGSYPFLVADDHGGIFVGSEKSVTRLNGRTGNEVWRYNAGENVLIGSYRALRRDDTLFFFEFENTVDIPSSYEVAAHLVSLQPDTGAATRLELPVSVSISDVVEERFPQTTQLVVLPDDTVAFGLSTFRVESPGNGDWNATSQLSLAKVDPVGGMSTQILSQVDDVVYQYWTSVLLPDSHGNLLMSWSSDGDGLPDTLARISPGGGVVSVAAPVGYEYEVADSHGFVYGWWADSPAESRFLSAMDTATLTRVWTDSTVDRYLGATIVSTLAGGGVLVKDQAGRLVKFDQTGVKTVLTEPIEAAAFEASAGGLMRVTSTDRTMVLFDEPLAGAWQTSGGNTSGQSRGTNPSLEVIRMDDYAPITSIRRTGRATFRILGISDPQDWRFVPRDATLSPISRSVDLDSPFWRGDMVTSGTVSVKGTFGGQLKTYKKELTVTRRTDGWLSTPAATQRVPNGTDGVWMPDPLPPRGSTLERPFGYSWARIEANDTSTPQPVNDSGPNHALYFVVTVPDDVSHHKHMIHPGLLNTSDPLYTSQWGTYHKDTNPSGWASGAALLQSVINHEAGYGDGVFSHYSFYRDAVEEVSSSKLKDKNLLYMLERVVGLSDDFYLRYGNQKAAVQTRIDAARSVEPCLGGHDEQGYGLDSGNSCERIGRVNTPPYYPLVP